MGEPLWRRMLGAVGGSAEGAGEGLGRAGGAGERGRRTTGDPQSSNGASSMHLRWADVGGPLTAVSVDLEVLAGPTVDRLYFWALQAGFSTGRSRGGAGHLGLQWHPRYPASAAVNWGGYASGGGELEGSALAVPSALGNPNTGDLRWVPQRRYRLAIGPWLPDDGPAGSWPGTVTDLESGDRLEVRRLYAPGPYLLEPVMWSEVFARCDHPPVTVRWSRPVAEVAGGDQVSPSAVVTSYQSAADGGCDNTTSETDAVGILQRTNVARTTPVGRRLAVRVGER